VPSAGPQQFHFLEQIGVFLATMSALERITDSGQTSRHVSNVPITDISQGVHRQRAFGITA
jgi:hypothetical protein